MFGGAVADSAASWAGVQTPRPAPTEGLIVTPRGSWTTACLTGESILERGSARPGLPFVRRKTKPDEEEALLTVRKPSGLDSKPSEPHSAIGAGVPPESRLTALALSAPGRCQESAAALKPSAWPHSVGRVRRASGLLSSGSPTELLHSGKVGSASFRQAPRSSLWEASQGAPQRSSLRPRSCSDCGTSARRRA